MKSITVKGTKYKIKLVDSIGTNSIALCDKDKKVIYLTKERSQDDLNVDLWHELIHCLFNELGLEQVINPEIEEIIAENFSIFVTKYTKKFKL